MILDQQTLFSDAQAITASAASTNVIDLGPIDEGIVRDIGKGKKIPFMCQVVADFDSAADDGTLTIAIQLDAAEGFGGGADKSIDLGTYDEADLVAGFQIPWDVLPRGVDLRYARLYYTVGGSGNFTAGAISAGITMGVPSNG